MTKTISFQVFEDIGIGLPNIYRCTQCKRLINCMHPPEGEVCSWCSGVTNEYEQLAQSKGGITDVHYSEDYGVLGYLFDTGAALFYGPGVLPGTDVPTYRFVYSSGFKSQEEYQAAQAKAQAYSKGLGFEGVQGHFESFQT